MADLPAPVQDADAHVRHGNVQTFWRNPTVQVAAPAAAPRISTPMHFMFLVSNELEESVMFILKKAILIGMRMHSK